MKQLCYNTGVAREPIDRAYGHCPGRFRDQRWDTAKQGGKKAATEGPNPQRPEPGVMRQRQS